jgi:hypothetical protein
VAELDKTNDLGGVMPVAPNRAPGQRRQAPRVPTRSSKKQPARHPRPDGEHKVDEYV